MSNELDEAFKNPHPTFTEAYLEKFSNEAFDDNRVTFFKRNLTGEEACKEMYKMGARHVMHLLWGLDSDFQFEKFIEKMKEEQKLIDEGL